MQQEHITIGEYFRGKNVFVTGATGFMGKVLVEKLLRSCPDIGRIYVLTRDKRGDDLHARWMAIGKLALFERLHRERPGVFAEKIHPIAGDMMLLNMGLSPSDYNLLIDDVDIIYHVAATVKFDQPLKDALLMNTRGTREVCKLALAAKHLDILMHISTAYTQTQHDTIEERIYPACADWKRCIEVAERCDKHTLQVVMGRFMEGYPNTYTFTKSLGENVVNDMLGGRIPNLILRPSIVVTTKDEPISGWSDNFNGPFGMFIGAATGLIRINLMGNMRLDYIAVDSAIKAFIIATWHKRVMMHGDDEKSTTVYNCSSGDLVDLRMFDAMRIARELTKEISMKICVWYPSVRTTESRTVYYLYVVLFHLIPAMFFDGILKLLGKQPMVWKIQRRIYVATMALNYFVTHEWRIINRALYGLEQHLVPCDRPAFGYEADQIDVVEFFRKAMLGSKVHLLKERMEDMPQHRRRVQIVYHLDRFFTVLWYTTLVYLVIFRWNLPGYAWHAAVEYFTAL